MEKKVAIIVVFFCIFISAIVIILSINNENQSNMENEYTENNTDTNTNDEDEDEDENDENINIGKIFGVNNHSEYFVIDQIMAKITSYINTTSNTGLYMLLDEDYKNSEVITTKNIDDYIDITFPLINTMINKIKYAQISETKLVYFLEVIVLDDQINLDYQLQETKIKYYAIFTDQNNSTFSFMPVTEEVMNMDEIPNNELYNQNEITNNYYNEYDIATASNIEIINLYFYNFRYNYITEREDLYEKINGNIPYNFTMDLSTSIDSYEYKYNDKYIKLIDVGGYFYTFTIENVLDYSVKISK